MHTLVNETSYFLKNNTNNTFTSLYIRLYGMEKKSNWNQLSQEKWSQILTGQGFSFLFLFIMFLKKYNFTEIPK